MEPPWKEKLSPDQSNTNTDAIPVEDSLMKTIHLGYNHEAQEPSYICISNVYHPKL